MKCCTKTASSLRFAWGKLLIQRERERESNTLYVAVVQITESCHDNEWVGT